MNKKNQGRCVICKVDVVDVSVDVDDDDVDQNLKCSKDGVVCLIVFIARDTLNCISVESNGGGHYRQGPVRRLSASLHTVVYTTVGQRI